MKVSVYNCGSGGRGISYKCPCNVQINKKKRPKTKIRKVETLTSQRYMENDAVFIYRNNQSLNKSKINLSLILRCFRPLTDSLQKTAMHRHSFIHTLNFGNFLIIYLGEEVMQISSTGYVLME